MGNIVAIIGRPNVGKSTLFNRILQRRVAVEEKQAGVTRDRLYGRAEWRGMEFTLVDTGGITFANGEKGLWKQVQAQAELAVEEAAVLLFVVDAKSGVTPLDQEIAVLIRKAGKPVVLVVNKVDNPSKQDIHEFYSLGFGDPIPVSAANSLNLGDLLDRVLELLPRRHLETNWDTEAIRVAVVGRPNVGKSSLINSLLDSERMIVSHLAGTTRDAVDTLLERAGKHFLFVDTAGIRRQSRVKLSLEYYSILRSFRAIEEADIALVMTDAEGIGSEQDKRIAGFVDEAGKGLIFLINKIDLVPGQGEDLIDKFNRSFGFVPYAYRLLISVHTGRGLKNIFPLIEQVDSNRRNRIPTPVVNDLFQDAFAIVPPPAIKGKRLKLYYATQAGVAPPRFILKVNDPSLAHFSYKRYLEKELRKVYDFAGTPVRIALQQHRKKERT